MLEWSITGVTSGEEERDEEEKKIINNIVIILKGHCPLYINDISYISWLCDAKFLFIIISRHSISV